MTEPLLVSVKQAAELLGGLSEKTVRDLQNDGTLESAYVGRLRKIPYESLKRYAAGLPNQAAS